MVTSFRVILFGALFLFAGCGDDKGYALLNTGGSTGDDEGTSDSLAIYVSTTQFTPALSTGIVKADNICQTDAIANGWSSGTYKAMLVASIDGFRPRLACTTANCSGGASENVDWILKPNTNYHQGLNPSKLIGTTNSAGIFATFSASFSDTVYEYWTGMEDDWTKYWDNCGNFEYNIHIAPTGKSGMGISTINIHAEPEVTCNNARHLICVQQ